MTNFAIGGLVVTAPHPVTTEWGSGEQWGLGWCKGALLCHVASLPLWGGGGNCSVGDVTWVVAIPRSITGIVVSSQVRWYSLILWRQLELLFLIYVVLYKTFWRSPV